jgi:hypothetical protein
MRREGAVGGMMRAQNRCHHTILATITSADLLLLKLGVAVRVRVEDGRLIRRYGPIPAWRARRMGIALLRRSMHRRRTEASAEMHELRLVA